MRRLRFGAGTGSLGRSELNILITDQAGLVIIAPLDISSTEFKGASCWCSLAASIAIPSSHPFAILNLEHQGLP